MAVAWVQNQVETHISTVGGETSLTFTLLNSFTSGNSLAGATILEQQSGQTITSITDNASPSNTYTLYDTAVPNGTKSVTSFALTKIVNIPSTITIHYSAGLDAAQSEYMFLDEISGAGSVNAHAALFNTPASTSISSGNMTTTGSGVLIWATKSNETVNSTTTAGSGFTLGLNDTTNSNYTEYSTPTVSAGTHAATFTLATADTATVNAVAFAPNTVTCGSFLLLGVGCGIAAHRLVRNKVQSRRDFLTPWKAGHGILVPRRSLLVAKRRKLVAI